MALSLDYLVPLLAPPTGRGHEYPRLARRHGPHAGVLLVVRQGGFRQLADVIAGVKFIDGVDEPDNQQEGRLRS